MTKQASADDEDAGSLKLGEVFFAKKTWESFQPFAYPIVKLRSDFNHAKCLLNSEVFDLLSSKQREREEANDSLAMSSVFEKSLAYVLRFSKLSNQESVQQLRGSLETHFKLHSFEVAVLGNQLPESVEEAKALVPSLGMEDRNPPITDEQIQAIIAQLGTIRKFE